jgi:hypothetical protein
MNSKPIPARGLLRRVPLLLLTLCLLTLAVQAQPTRPMGYWRFENPTPTQEASNNGYNVIINTTNLTLANPIVGQYYHVTGTNPTPAVSATIDDASNMTEVAMEFWFRATLGTETGSTSWSNKTTFYFFEDRLIFEVNLQSYMGDMEATHLATVVKAQVELMEADSTKAAGYAALLNLDLPTEANHRRVLEVRLDGAMIDSAELATLQAIAAQCERAGGKGVNLARALLAAEGIMVWDDSDCPPAAKAAQPASAGADAVQARCWPNPTDGRLHIDFSAPGQQGRVKVFDALGQLLEERGFDYQDTPVVLDGSRWSQGLLLVVVEMADGGRHAWRVLLH